MVDTSFFSWSQFLVEGAPRRFQVGNLGRLVGATLGVPSDVTSQGTDEAFLHRCLDQPSSPDDFLPLAAIERRLPRYPVETADHHRARLLDAWKTWSGAGGDQGIIDQLAIIGVSARILFNIGPAGTAFDGTTQLSSDHVKTYPASSEWWAQFNVVIEVPGTIYGSGAVPWIDGYTGTPSVFVSQEYLDTIRIIIDLFKPVGWRCREIIFMNDAGTLFWGDPDVTWGGFTWGAGGAFTEEHYPSRNITPAEWLRINR